jgi:hypothetical protein
MSGSQLPPNARAQAAPRGTLVADRARLEIHLARVDDLHEALAAAASAGLAAIGFDFCFYDEGDATCRTSRRHAARGPNAEKHVVDTAIDRVRDLLEDAIREALQEEFDYDREIRVDVGLRFDAEKSSWDLNGSATAYDIVSDLTDINVCFA